MSASAMATACEITKAARAVLAPRWLQAWASKHLVYNCICNSSQGIVIQQAAEKTGCLSTACSRWTVHSYTPKRGCVIELNTPLRAQSFRVGSYCPFYFFFNDTATTEIYTLSLHDALPICHGARQQARLHRGIHDHADAML